MTKPFYENGRLLLVDFPTSLCVLICATRRDCVNLIGSQARKAEWLRANYLVLLAQRRARQVRDLFCRYPTLFRTYKMDTSEKNGRFIRTKQPSMMLLSDLCYDLSE